MEKWKKFEYKGKEYRISSLGKLVYMKTGENVVTRINEDGYMEVRLGNWRERKIFRMHRLVATFFVNNKNPEIYNEVNHLDFNRLNNRFDNLEWCTHRQNIRYSYDAKRLFVQNANISGKNNPNYGNHILSTRYANDPALSQLKQSRAGSKNGRCIPIRMISQDRSFSKNFDYMGECAQYMIDNKISFHKKSGILGNIVKCLNNENIPYLGYYFERI